MLKVVGASWEKTRLTTIMLGTVSAIAVFAIFFFELPPEANDGNYAATVFWSDRTGFRVEFWGQGNDPRYVRHGAARAYYKSDIKSSGWASIEIESDGSYPDWVQAHGAGLLEGALSWQLIYWHWQNTVGNVCAERARYCRDARQFIRENTYKVKATAFEKQYTDPYWYQVYLFYQQLDGLEVGWRYAVERSRKNKEIDIEHVDFLWMNSLCDLKDLEMKYNFSTNPQPTGKPLSIALLKLLNNTSENKFLMAHASAGYYTEMLRLQKRYKLSLRSTAKNTSDVVAGQSIQFTSYPGALHSQDDFYQISAVGRQHQLVVSGSAIKIYNSSLFDDVDSNQVMMGARVMSANRLAVNASDWASLVGASNSGTGNKQWMVVEATTVVRQTWLVEQLPAKSLAADITRRVDAQSYWACFGLPYHPELKKLVGYEKAGEDIVSLFDKTADILRRGQAGADDVESLVRVMRGPELALLGRSDIADDEPTTAWARGGGGDGDRRPVHYGSRPEQSVDTDAALTSNGILHKELNGNTDLKVWSGGESGSMSAVAGPPYSHNGIVPIDPFQWSKTLFNDIWHQGQPDVWNFQLVRIDWAWL